MRKNPENNDKSIHYASCDRKLREKCAGLSGARFRRMPFVGGDYEMRDERFAGFCG